MEFRSTARDRKFQKRWLGFLPLGALIGVLLLALPVAAQSFSVLHSFSGGGDGATPMAGLTLDRAGNLYGTTNYGGNLGGNCGASGCGTVFRMARQGSSWLVTPLYSFSGGTDGANPNVANVVFGADGGLYGSTFNGASDSCDSGECGIVFKLQPGVTACKTALCPWNETILHAFDGNSGAGPVGTLIFDQQGNIFGATTAGGFQNGGVVYQLVSGNNYLVKIVWSPYGYPGSGVTLDNAGNLFGSTFVGGNNRGSVFKLTQSGGAWFGMNIYDFTNGDDGGYPWAGVIFDQAGSLYGATSTGGSGNGGTVFQMTHSDSGWSLSTLYSFAGPNNGQMVVGPVGNLVFDQAGNLYGTTVADGANKLGAVFKLTPSNGGWTYISLHDFTGGADGAYPFSNLVFDAQGNIYGTASSGGGSGLGVVFEISQ